MKTSFTCLVILLSAFMSAHAGYENWRWNRGIPQDFNIKGAPQTVRDPNTFDRFKFFGTTTLKDVILAFGVPDEFSPQFMYSMKKGTEYPAVLPPRSGTVRYLLSDGGEVQIYVHDFSVIELAIRYEKTGRGHLLYK